MLNIFHRKSFELIKMESNKVPIWLHCSKKYIDNSDSEQLIYYDIYPPESSQILNIDDFEKIVNICKEWEYENEGRKYPIDVYVFCLLNKDEVLSSYNSEYTDIYEMIEGNGSTPLELFYPSIGLYIKEKREINEKSKLWLTDIVPILLVFKINAAESNGIITFNMSLNHNSQKFSIKAQIQELREFFSYLSNNFINLLSEYKIYDNKLKNLDDYEEKQETLKKLDTINSKLRNKHFNFQVHPDDLFLFNKYTEVVKNVQIPNVLIYHFIITLSEL